VAGAVAIGKIDGAVGAAEAVATAGLGGAAAILVAAGGATVLLLSGPKAAPDVRAVLLDDAPTGLLTADPVVVAVAGAAAIGILIGAAALNATGGVLIAADGLDVAGGVVLKLFGPMVGAAAGGGNEGAGATGARLIPGIEP
jgi:hypothetical protein